MVPLTRALRKTSVKSQHYGPLIYGYVTVHIPQRMKRSKLKFIVEVTLSAILLRQVCLEWMSQEDIWPLCFLSAFPIQIVLLWKHANVLDYDIFSEPTIFGAQQNYTVSWIRIIKKWIHSLGWLADKATGSGVYSHQESREKFVLSFTGNFKGCSGVCFPTSFSPLVLTPPPVQLCFDT